MMRVLFFADTHLGFDFPVRPRIERRRRGWDFFNNYQHILDIARDEKVDALVHGGDLFFRSKIPKSIIEKSYEPLLPILDSGIDILIIPGNHERSKLPNSPLFHHPKMHVFDRPRTFVIENEISRVAFGGIPNIRHDIEGNFNAAIEQTELLRHDGLKVMCLHQAIEDAVVGVQNYRFRKGPDVIGLDQFPENLDLVLSGHIHRQQVLTASNGTPIIYPGSIERTSYAERLETKGYYMIDIGKGGISWEFRPLPSRPMLEWTLKPDVDEKSKLLEVLEEGIGSLPEDVILRIRCSQDLQLDLIKISELRKIFPETMNIDLLPPRLSRRYS